MPERPVIVLPVPAPASRSTLGSGFGRIRIPDRAYQARRLSPKFETLRVNLEQRTARFLASAAGLVPEEVIVFETVGSIGDFLTAAARVPGLDMLAEWDVEDIAPDADFYDQKRRDKPLSGRLFLVMTNQQALRELLRLWEVFQNGGQATRGFAPFIQLFAHLKDVRLWSTKDRLLETGVVEYWQDASRGNDQTAIPFEIELWFRQTPLLREQAIGRIRDLLQALGGSVTSICELPPIGYHAVVASLPAATVRTFVARQDVDLLGESVVMCFRPSGQSVVPDFEDGEPESSQTTLPSIEENLPPIVALFDGLPLENHLHLEGRLSVDDPDGYAEGYIAARRKHGTAMASIILHGDLSARRESLKRPLYVRPIMRPHPQEWANNAAERVPFGVNALDLTHRCIRRILEGDGTVAAVAPTIKIVNFSIGDPMQQFTSAVSAWGRLLDWLSVKYNILFCVSAGNHATSLELDVERTAFAGLSPQLRQVAVLRTLQRDLRHRRILAPSDSINSVTVGGWHHDYGDVRELPHRVNPFSDSLLPIATNGLGGGFRNATKPEILMPGGRQFYEPRMGNGHQNAILEVSRPLVAPGIRAAAPGADGIMNGERHTRGTSNATALATRSAAFLYEQLLSLRAEADGGSLTDEYVVVLLKAMLVHQARWNEAARVLREVLTPLDMRESRFRRLAARFLGYGFVEPVESLTCSEHRATMLGRGELLDGAAHEYQIPLPSGLSGRRGLRRIVVTLAWLSPISPRHRNYRAASLWFEVEHDKLSTNRQEAEWQSVRNGTVQHEIFEGEQASAFAQDATLRVKVNCRADAGTFTEAIRYGIVVTIEVAEEVGVAVYDEIVNRIRPTVPIRAAGV